MTLGRQRRKFALLDREEVRQQVVPGKAWFAFAISNQAYVYPWDCYFKRVSLYPMIFSKRGPYFVPKDCNHAVSLKAGGPVTV